MGEIMRAKGELYKLRSLFRECQLLDDVKESLDITNAILERMTEKMMALTRVLKSENLL